MPVYEDFRHEWGRLRLLQVRSTNAAALEYFRWEAPVRRLDEQHLVIDAPDVVEDRLVIRVAEQAQQRLRTRPGHFLQLSALTTNTVSIRGGWRPLIAWLPLYARQLD